MTYWMSAAAVAFASFAVVATLTSIFVGLVAPAVARRSERYSAASRAALLLRLRLLPAAVATIWAFGIALPVFLWFEPHDTDETLARTLIVAALVGVALLGRGAWRGAAALRATRAVTRQWRQGARRLDMPDIPMPVFAVEESFPMVTVAGFSHPSLFMAERVLRECGEDEVRAMMLHECAHVTQRDNLKRFLIRACPDFVGAGGPLDRAWASAAEEAADAMAVAIHPGFALELAQALIRVARLAPRPTLPELASSFYPGGSIESRVRRLLDPASPPEFTRPLGGVMLCTLACAAATLIVVAAPAIDQLMEVAVGLP
jgi:Peptidase family M48